MDNTEVVTPSGNGLQTFQALVYIGAAIFICYVYVQYMKKIDARSARIESDWNEWARQQGKVDEHAAKVAEEASNN